MTDADSEVERPTPASIAGYVRRHAARAKKALMDMHEHAPAETIRTVDYQGHRIVIGTTYRIEVDGRRVGGHFVVTDEGQVQCHALPNYTFSSAVDMVKAMVDVFPEDFSGTPGPGEHEHGSHGGGAMAMAKARPVAPSRPAAKPARAAKKAAPKPSAGTAKRRRHGRH
jgi:hypothetical protein